jgi:integrase
MPSPRRTAVKNHRGIYYRVDQHGRRRYEISFTDSTGRRRWKTIEGKLEDAQAALDEIRGKKRRGEKVAPPRATLAEVADLWIGSQAQLRPRTRERYEVALRVHVLPRLGRIRVAELTEDHVAFLIEDMRAGVSFHDPEREAIVGLRQKLRGSRAWRNPNEERIATLEAEIAEREAAWKSHGPRLERTVRDKPFDGWTVRATLTPLSRIMAFAVRRGMAAANPVTRLERGERPSVGRREMWILERDEIEKLLAAASDRYRPLLATAVFTGLRLGELLGLTWADVDFDAGLVRVRKQLDTKHGTLVETKTPQAVRDVVLMPALGRLLREHKLASPHSTRTDPVFASTKGTPMHVRNISRRGLEKAIEKAELEEEGKPRFRFHDFRHTFASLLIAQGADVVFVSRQIGHANPSITLGIYSHLFDRAQHAERTSALLEAGFGSLLDGVSGTVLETSTGEQRRITTPAADAAKAANVAPLHGSGDYRLLPANASG